MWHRNRRPAPRQPLDIGDIYDKMRSGQDTPAYIEPPPPALESNLERELENESQAEQEEGRN